MGYQCSVCGYMGLHEPGRREHGYPSEEICACCGFQFGVTDDDRGFTYEQWRQKWIEGGMKWRWQDEPPLPDWDPREQLRNIGSWFEA